MNISSVLNLDMASEGSRQFLHVKQNDILTRSVDLTLYAGGTVWQVPSGTSMAICYRKPDGTLGYYDTMPDGVTPACTASGNTVHVLIAPQMCTVAGTVICELRMTADDGSALGTFAWYCEVHKSAYSGIPSDDYYNVVSIEGLSAAIGKLTSLNTTAKSNLVAAINEVSGRTGSLSALSTQNKNSLVAAINEVLTKAVKGVNQIYPDAQGNVALYAEDIPVQINTFTAPYTGNVKGAMEQIVSDIASVSGTRIYTEIEKINGVPKKLRIHLHGLTHYAGDTTLSLQMWRRVQKRGIVSKWAFPGKWGYGNLVGHHKEDEPLEFPSDIYPPVPDWMPNNGLVVTKYSVYDANGALLPYVDISIGTMMLPLLKPLDPLTRDDLWVLGLSSPHAGRGLRNTHPLRFDVFRGDNLLAPCRNIVYIGPSRDAIKRGTLLAPEVPITAAGVSGAMYVKVT
jgi:hypothetical protein